MLRTLELTGLPHPEFPSALESAIFGISILGAATLLIWASEVAEQLVASTLALAVLAIVAVLPEYSVDLYFAWTAPDNPENAQFALANMTGANRLLIGLAWPLVFLVFWLREHKRTLKIGRQNALGIVFLGAATIYSFSIPIRGHLSLLDSVVLIGIFVVYLILSARGPSHTVELVGPARSIGALPDPWRKVAVIAIFAYAAGVVFSAAEPFAQGLIDSGESFGINEFFLVQWIAPLASEAPEFLLAAMLALRGRAAAGMALLLASKVNQWTLLVGSLPLAFAISGGSLSPLDIDARQSQELFLTAAQSLFAVAVLTSLSLSAREAGLIFVLFAIQLAVPIAEVRLAFGVLYLLLALFWFATERREAVDLFRSARSSISPETAGGEPGNGET